MDKQQAAKSIGYSERKVANLVRKGEIRTNKDGSLNKRDVRWSCWFEQYRAFAKRVRASDGIVRTHTYQFR